MPGDHQIEAVVHRTRFQKWSPVLGVERESEEEEQGNDEGTASQ
jgi:hypothetical protein